MRLPIILMLLVIVLLPADLHGLVDDVGAGIRTTASTVTKYLDRGEGKLTVAEAKPELPIGYRFKESR